MNRALLLLSVCAVFLVSGCTTVSGPGWGDRAGFGGITADRVGKSLLGAIIDPRFLVPVAGAAIFSIDDWDEKTSDWAVDHRPLFNSENTAKEFSDAFLGVLGAETLVTIALTPSGTEETDDWLSGKMKGLLVEAAAFGATTSASEFLKETVERRRPGMTTKTSSFPSGHAAEAASFATLTRKNLESIHMDPRARSWINAGNTALVGLTAWARVEAEKHFPADVLGGAALGHLLTTFVHDLFMGEELGDGSFVTFAFERGRATMGLSWRF